MTTGKLCNTVLIHQNIQGFSSKELEVDLLLNDKYNDIHLLCITEHWLNEFELHMLHYNNHSIVSSFTRKSAIRGGSLIIVNNSLKSKERKDVVRFSIERTIELSCVEIEHYIIVCVYRPPSADFQVFESVMEDVLKLIIGSKRRIVICGDFNIDLLIESQVKNRLLNLFQSFNLIHLYCEPTRITSTTATCIDNVFVNCDIIERSIINYLTSDHCGQMVLLPNNVEVKSHVVTYRPITVNRIQHFIDNINSNLSLLPSLQSGPDALYENLFSLIKSEFDKFFTIKQKTITAKIKFDDWATSGIYKSRNKLFDLYNKKTYIHDSKFVEYVRNYSKLFKKVCLIAKSNYISGKIKRSGNAIKTTWNIINRETGKIGSKEPQFKLKIDGETIHSDSDVANEFERFFSNIPVTTTRSLSSSSVDAESYLRESTQKCNLDFQFKHVTPDTIYKTFASLNVKKTEDLWGISVHITKYIIHSLSPHLAFIFNKCVDEGLFPNLMKLSKIIPVFKSGERCDPTNFRPISILPVLSKIFEKIILNQLLLHFNSNNLLHNQQFGFTKGRSTTDAGVALLKHVYGAWEKSRDAIGVFCDLSKAFDCVDHDTLIRKLTHYGVSGGALDLILSYLNNRTQQVDINGSVSSGSPVVMGVPQGSILGPFLFLVYVNDLPFYTSKLCDIVLFADDTSLIFKVDRKQTNFDDVNSTLCRVLKWFTANNLVLNTKKTKCIKFSLPNVRPVVTDLVMDGDSLELVDSTVFLGVTIDPKLQWGPHITALAKKLSSAVYAIKKIRQLTNVDTARLVYFSYFHSIMSYGILLWGNAADINSIFILQKRAIRSIYNLGSRATLRELFKEIKILTVASQYIYANILHVYQNLQFYDTNGDVHNINTRNQNNLVLPSCRLEKVKSSFVGRGVRFFNKIPADARDLPPIKFKNFVKNALIKKAYYSVDDYLNDKNAF